MTNNSNPFSLACRHLLSKYTISTLQSTNIADNQIIADTYRNFPRFTAVYSGLLRCVGRGEKVGKDAVGGAEVGADVGTGAFAGIFQENRRQQQGIERLREAAGIGDREAATALDEVAGFLEFLMVGAENHRYAIYCGFVEIMDSGSEPAADIGDVGEAVERRQFAERIDDDAAYVFHPHGHGSAGGA